MYRVYVIRKQRLRERVREPEKEGRSGRSCYRQIVTEARASRARPARSRYLTGSTCRWKVSRGVLSLCFPSPVRSPNHRACVRASDMMRCNRVEQITCYVVTVSSLGPVYNFRLVNAVALVHFFPLLVFPFSVEERKREWGRGRYRPNNYLLTSGSAILVTITLSCRSLLYPVSSPYTAAISCARSDHYFSIFDLSVMEWSSFILAFYKKKLINLINTGINKHPVDSCISIKIPYTRSCGFY